MGKREQRKDKETERVTEKGRLRWSVMLEKEIWPLLLHLLLPLLLSKLRLAWLCSLSLAFFLYIFFDSICLFPAPGCSGREKDQISGGAAGRNPNEEAGN